MDKTSLIYWFSGTGNSLYAAKKLSVVLGDIPLVRITDEPPTEPVGGIGAKIGFVFPSYYGNLPRAVRAFVEKLEIKPDTYIFAIVTMGAPFGLGSVAAIDKTLNAKGLKLNYGRGVVMPANYVISYNPADTRKSGKRLDKTDKRIQEFASHIKIKEQSLKTLPITANNLYKNIESLDAAFTVNGNCTGCGLCERICPVRNIRLENSKPQWLNRCEHCVACISWCPSKAIEYGSKTQSRRRYRNLRIKAEELMMEIRGGSVD
jgi:ferredoxin